MKCRLVQQLEDTFPDGKYFYKLDHNNCAFVVVCLSVKFKRTIDHRGWYTVVGDQRFNGVFVANTVALSKQYTSITPVKAIQVQIEWLAARNWHR